MATSAVQAAAAALCIQGQSQNSLETPNLRRGSDVESRQHVQWSSRMEEASKHFIIHRPARIPTSSRHVYLVALGATVLPFCLFRRPVPPEPLPGTPLKPHTWHRARSPLRVRASRRHAGTRARASQWCRWGARRLGDPDPHRSTANEATTSGPCMRADGDACGDESLSRVVYQVRASWPLAFACRLERPLAH